MADFDIETVRAALRDAMARKDMKPTTLSLMVGTNRTLVKNLLEKNRDVSLGTIHKLAEALNVEPAYLAFGDTGGGVWLPRPETIAVLLGGVKRALSGSRVSEDDLLGAAGDFVAALWQIAERPDRENKPDALELMADQIAGGQSHQPPDTPSLESHK